MEGRVRVVSKGIGDGRKGKGSKGRNRGWKEG